MIEFLLDQYLLVGIWLTLLFLLLKYESMKAGAPVSTQQLSMLVNQEQAVVLDVRDGKDFKQGHIVDSVNIPFKDIASRLGELKEKDTPVIVVCKMGQTASAASKQLKAAGFSKVYKLTGGLSEWQAANLPLVK